MDVHHLSRGSAKTPPGGCGPAPGASGVPGPRTAGPGPGTADTAASGRRLEVVISASFVLLLIAAMARFLTRHPGAPTTWWVIALTTALAVAYAARPAAGGNVPVRWQRVWFGAFIAGWVALVLQAPSFAWSAVALLYTALQLLPERAALALSAVLAVLVVVAQVRIDGPDPLLIVVPPVVAGLAATVFVHMRRQSVRQRTLIEDLVRTRRGLASSERRAGVLAERERLSREIHDTLAQALSSQRMLLQAAERLWDEDPAAARGHMATASDIAERNLVEARRFVHDLAPADLAAGGGLPDALRALARRETAAGAAAGETTGGTTGGSPATGPAVTFRTDGEPVPLPPAVAAALLRVAQGAVANVREHARATDAVLTLSYLDEDVVLDIADNGRGFTPPHGTASAALPRRGHGLRAMEARMRQLDGTLTVESHPGEGTVVSAAVPLRPNAPAAGRDEE
ncbi:sensor histidine kinase [Streptomyces sp. RS10V-4]|uniref:sensor histidine kinase n=1 Tax=Streptomyces rhizoryzae TaxID=2932493 RepID=UPI002002F912|nr:sensor histidine kinase [Streptomyces rhizoryzae]MCK7622271.1 sensor histidine kinase [Streptomyces rhizoryzae]